MSRRSEGSSSGQPDAKRARNENPPSYSMEDIRARVAASKAAMQARLAGKATASSSGNNDDSRASSSTPPVSSAPVATSSASTVAPGPAAMPPKPTMDASVADKIAAAKRRIEQMTAKAANPYLSGSGTMSKPEPKAQAVGVTSIALHPLLMGGQQQQEAQAEKNEKKALRDRYKPMAPKFSSVKANINHAQASAPAGRPAPTSAVVVNPYSAAPAATAAADNAEGEGANTRRSRKLNFSAQGKYVKLGDALRNEAKMDALRQRIAEASRKAGLDSEFDTLERSLKRQPPPEVEWWDKALLPEGSSYDDIDKAMTWITTSEDSLVTHLVQHPIPIPAPGDKKTEERGLMLTKKEQKKMRRQRRQAELEDKRDRQKMGLLPPDPPKVRLANLMKVLTSDAVQDPTKVEAKVRKEVAQRAQKHEDDNQSRKLTAEEKKEKEYQRMLAKERRGIYGAVFKVKYLSNGRHKYKVRETAKKDLLSGVCIFNPNFALVLVEGTDKGIKHYKQLMLNRIDWTEQARPLAEGGAGAGAGDEGVDGKEGDGDDKEDDDEVEADGENSLADNKCELIWEGEVPERTFKQFRARHSESDTSAKEWLTPKWEGMWDLAKRWVWTGEDF